MDGILNEMIRGISPLISKKIIVKLEIHVLLQG